MDYCDCGAPLEFSPDGVHCVSCYEAMVDRLVDQHGEMSFDPDQMWWCDEWGHWHRGVCYSQEQPSKFIKWVVLFACVVELLWLGVCVLPSVQYGMFRCVLIGVADALSCAIVTWAVWWRSEKRPQ